MHAEIQRSKRVSTSSSSSSSSINIVNNNNKDNGTEGGAYSSRGIGDGSGGGVGRSIGAATSTDGNCGEEVQVLNEPKLGKRKGPIVLDDTVEEKEEEETRRNGLKRQKNEYERIESDHCSDEDEE